MSDHPYRHGFEDGSAYAHAWNLLDTADLAPGVVVDLGCGFGALAEHVVDRGFGYVGLDFDPAGVDDLRARGFEAATIDLEDPTAAMAALDAAVAGRPVAAYLLLDVLEHLTEPGRIAAAVRARDDGAALIVSIPNVSHLDLVGKLLSGRWEMTETGLLDRTHIRFFTDAEVTGQLGAAGWVEQARNDVVSDQSDQTFPADLPVLLPHSTVRDVLAGLRSRADGHGATYQFVRRYAPGDPVRWAPGPVRTAGAPDLSLVVTDPTDLPSLLEDLAQRPWADRVEVITPSPVDAASVPAALGGRVVQGATTVGALRQRPSTRLAVVSTGVTFPDAVVTQIEQAEAVARGHIVWFAPDGPDGAPPPDPFDLTSTGAWAPLTPAALLLPVGALELVSPELDLAVDEQFVAAVAEMRLMVGVHRRPEPLFAGPGADRSLDADTVADALTSHLKESPVTIPAGGLAMLVAVHRALREARETVAELGWIKGAYRDDLATKDAQIEELADGLQSAHEAIQQLDSQVQLLARHRDRLRQDFLQIRTRPEVRIGGALRVRWSRARTLLRRGGG